MSHQAEAPSLEQLARQRLVQVAFITKQAPLQLFRQFGHGSAIVDVAGGELTRQQLAVMVDHDMQLEAIEPTERGFATLREVAKHAMALNPAIMADGERGGVHE